MPLFNRRSISLGFAAICWAISIPWVIYDWSRGQPPFESAIVFLGGLAGLISYRYGPDPNPAIPVSQTTTASSGGVAIAGSVIDSKISTGPVVHYHEAPRPQPPTYHPPTPPAADKLPERGDLPPGSLMPFLPNAVFTGRQEDLLDLANDLLHSNIKAVGLTQAAAVTTGYGGIGKTQLAVEFCYRYGRFFQGVHWIRADQDIPAEISACGEAMGLPFWPKEQPEQVKHTLRAWQEGEPRLVVLDNITDQAVIQKWMPQMPRCHLLLTTRQSEWPRDLELKIRPLDVLPRDKSKELLRKLAPRLQKEPDVELDKIADRLGDLPLALDLAGRYLADRPELTPEGYLKALKDAGNALKHSSLEDWVKHNPTEHATNLAATFALSWDRLGDDGADDLAKRIFRACGYCAPNTPIPTELLAKAVRSEESGEMLDRALARLSMLGLATLTDGRPVLHPLLAEFARMQDEASSILPELAEALADIAYQANATGLPEQMGPWRKHLETVAQAADDRELLISGRLWNALAYHLRDVAEYEGARKHFERALKISENTLGPDHPEVAIMANNLGWVLQDLGDLLGAKKHFERALKISENTFGPDHPDVAIYVNNLGLVLKDLGNLREARILCERALKIDEKAFGPDHPNVAFRVNNLGGVLQDLGDLQAAKKHYERALMIDEKAFGPDHPTVAIDVNNLGLVLKYLGDLQAAKKHYDRALQIDEKALGPDHPRVAIDVNNLGSVLKDLGNLQEARILCERALKIDEKALGPDHHTVAIDVNNLGLVLKDLGDLQGAKKYFERALQIDEKALGTDHHTVAIRVNNLGLVLKDLGDLQGAKKHLERALRISEKHLKPNHHQTMTIRQNLEGLE